MKKTPKKTFLRFSAFLSFYCTIAKVCYCCQPESRREENFHRRDEWREEANSKKLLQARIRRVLNETFRNLSWSMAATSKFSQLGMVDDWPGLITDRGFSTFSPPVQRTFNLLTPPLHFKPPSVIVRLYPFLLSHQNNTIKVQIFDPKMSKHVATTASLPCFFPSHAWTLTSMQRATFYH